jgi:uncharacterized protein YndB with AHSA1/START domain
VAMSAPSRMSLPPPAPSRAGKGMAQVSVLVSASADVVWAALTERTAVARWFGDLSETLKPNCTCRLDFGDGDYFVIEDVVLAPPSC